MIAGASQSIKIITIQYIITNIKKLIIKTFQFVVENILVKNIHIILVN